MSRLAERAPSTSCWRSCEIEKAMIPKPVISTSEFDKQVKALSKPKKHPKLKSDLAKFIHRLAAGEIAKKRARDVASAPVFAARMSDSSSGVGSSGGFRVLYFEDEDARILLHIDRRREMDRWPTDLILTMLQKTGLWSPDN